MDVVNDVLQKCAQEAAGLKGIDVEKHLPLEIDVGTLLACDSNELDLKEFKKSPNEYLKSLARDNTQLLFNEIWKLPTDKVEGVTIAKLPKPKVVLPRALPVPKPKGMTKWERFAKEKGIEKKKKDKLKWDEILKKWVPLYGYKKSEAEKQKQWVIEVPDNADPYEDQFEKNKKIKDEKVAKNEFQRLRNIAKSKNIKIPKVGFAPNAKPSADQLDAALTVAKVSTASLGKFQKGIPKEKTAKRVKEFLPGSRKRKAALPTPVEEKKQSLELIDRILNKKPKINIDQAVDKQVRQDNIQEAKTQKAPKNVKKKSGKKTKAGAKGGKFRNPKNKKTFSGKETKGRGQKGGGQRAGGQKGGGRKRR